MMKRKITVLIFALLSVYGVQSQDKLSINGYARNYTGLLTREPNEFSIIQNTLDLNFEKRTDKVAFKVNTYLYHYSDKRLDFGLREAYVEMYFKNFDIRAGK